MTNLDTDRFLKVYALVKEGATEGERAAAEARATEIAEKAGMTLAEAVELCEGCNPASPTDRTDMWKRVFEELAKDPEYRKRREERERENAARRAQLLKEYGSEEAIFEETEREKLLSAAVDHLKEWKEYVDEATGEVHRYASGIEGYDCFSKSADIAPSILEAVASAYPVPDDLTGVLEEYRYWDKLYVDRQLFEPVEHWPWVEVRVRLLENILDTRPVQSWQDMQARMEWWQIEIDLEMQHPDGWEQKFHDRVVADLAILQAMSRDHVHSSQPINQRRTNADKRHQVTELLRKHPDLSNREIARRAGVSPQTVVNWRNRLAEEEGRRELRSAA
jgi:DNA-binding transcriptional regulator YiaG